MLYEILDIIGIVFQWQNILAILMGVIFGVVMGAIPGLTGTMGIALIIPITYNFDPIIAFSLLLGTYKGCLFGGAIPSILINTPGTPAAAATILDGYPMAKKGRGEEAVKIALWSSVIADIFATIVLIFGAVYLASLAKRVGPAEYAVLILFSLTIIAGVSGDSLGKGIMMTVLGFLFAMVGLDPIAGTERFIFGKLELMGGISIMAMLIGLFAVSEILLQLENDSNKQHKNIQQQQKYSTFKNIKKCFPTIFRGSIIGLILGAIPGLGSAPAAFVSYSEAKRKSPHPEKFGTGIEQGVAAPESANNATCGGALIPLMSLGIPGDVITAILLGAFMIHGLTPGPALFTDNIEAVYTLFVILLCASAVLPLVGSIAARMFTFIVDISKTILYPTIMVFCILGVYSFNASFMDVKIMILFGVLGYFMRKLNYPITPLMIGFVLEPIGERSIRQALLISDGDWFIFVSSPITIIFMILTIISVGFIFKNKVTGKQDG